MTIDAITNLPQPTDTTAEFSLKAFGVWPQLNTFATQANALASAITASAESAAEDAGDAEDSSLAAIAAAQSALSSLSAVQAITGMIPETVSATSVSCISGKLYIFANASASTGTLPSSPENGDVIGFDAGNNRTDNIINPNGKTIRGSSENMKLDMYPVTLVYRADLNDWRFA